MKNVRNAFSLLIVGLLILSTYSCSTHKKGLSTIKRPSAEKIQYILDSICIEGKNLYHAERANWIATDTVVAHFGMDAVGGSVRWQPADSIWCITFFDATQQYTLMEMRYNCRNEEYGFTYTQRFLTDAEKNVMKLHNRMFENAINNYRDSIHIANPEFGNPNFDFIRINNKTIRMYILQGTNKPNLIPFGLDYSFDFDYNGNVKVFRRYHQSLIPIPTVSEEGEKVGTPFHSHLKNNPYITPTDICNFLLYRNPEMKQMYILSTALDGYIIYQAENNSAVFLSKEAMDKIFNR